MVSTTEAAAPSQANLMRWLFAFPMYAPMNTCCSWASLGPLEAAFGMDVDYAQLVKVYGDIPEGERRYSTPQCKAAAPKVIQGAPNPVHINTSYIERQNLTMRMSNRRYTRLTNAFSKKLRNHEYHNALHFAHYNFCRIHKTLRMTPAMAAGVTDTLRDTEWIVGLIDANAPKPQKPGPKGPWKHKR